MLRILGLVPKGSSLPDVALGVVDAIAVPAFRISLSRSPYPTEAATMFCAMTNTGSAIHWAKSAVWRFPRDLAIILLAVGLATLGAIIQTSGPDAPCVTGEWVEN